MREESLGGRGRKRKPTEELKAPYIGFRLEKDSIAKLDALADSRGVSRSYLVRRLIETELGEADEREAGQ